MAIYSASTKSISRKQGRSATAAIAYRAGEKIEDKRTGNTHDYTQKQGVLHTKIITPDGSSISRSDLWNMAEESEKRKDARVAREWLVALPHELDEQHRNELAEGFAGALVKRYGCAADVCIHAPDKEGDNRNYHAHIMLTTRKLENGQLTDKTHAEWSDRKRKEQGMERMSEEIKTVRQGWENMANKMLERAGVDERIDHRSHAELYGDDKLPTIKMGQAATELERQGIRTERGDHNRSVKAYNRSMAEQYALIQQLKQLDKQLQEAQKRPSERPKPEPKTETPKPSKKPSDAPKTSSGGKKTDMPDLSNPVHAQQVYSELVQIEAQFHKKLFEREVEKTKKAMSHYAKEYKALGDKPKMFGKAKWEEQRNELGRQYNQEKRLLETLKKLHEKGDIRSRYWSEAQDIMRKQNPNYDAIKAQATKTIQNAQATQVRTATRSQDKDMER